MQYCHKYRYETFSEVNFAHTALTEQLACKYNIAVSLTTIPPCSTYVPFQLLHAALGLHVENPLWLNQLEHLHMALHT